MEDPSSEEGDFKDYINPDSLKVVKGFAEPALRMQSSGTIPVYTQRIFCLDKDSLKKDGI